MLGSLIGGALGGLGAYFGGKERADGMKDATNAALKRMDAGLDRLNESSLSQIGAGAIKPYNAMLGLLGVGGNPAEAQIGLNNFMDSSGYRTQLNSGMEALQAVSSAGGMRKSGAHTKEAIRFGQGLGSQYFNNYLSQLMGASQQGLTAETNRANIDASLAGGGANIALQGGMAQANAEGDMLSDLGGILNNTITSVWGDT